MPPKVTIYTDGAARGNPGPGGYGVVMRSGKHYREISEGYRLTTNNRMELLAVIVALESLKVPGSQVDVYTDSRYVCDAVEKAWVFDWEKKRFKKKKNVDLWQRFLVIFRKHKVNFHWVKGHANIPDNERCDQLAVEASNEPQLRIDDGYELQEGEDSMW